MDELLQGVVDVNGWVTEFGKVSGAAEGYRRTLGWLEEYTNDVYEGYSYKQVYGKGGFEGGGDSVERVYEIFKDGQSTGIFFQHDGFYSSYEGTEWDTSVCRVYPRQVVVTKYFDSPEA